MFQWSSPFLQKLLVVDKKEGNPKIQKFEYFENKKSFLDEIKSTFHNYLRTIFWWKTWKIAAQALTSTRILFKYSTLTKTGLAWPALLLLFSPCIRFCPRILPYFRKANSNSAILANCLQKKGQFHRNYS